MPSLGQRLYSSGSSGQAIAIFLVLGILALSILCMVGWGYSMKFAFMSNDNGDTRCTTLTTTQRNLVRLFLIMSLTTAIANMVPTE